MKKKKFELYQAEIPLTTALPEESQLNDFQRRTNTHSMRRTIGFLLQVRCVTGIHPEQTRLQLFK